MAKATIDVVVTATVRRGASLAARAKLYSNLIERMAPAEINQIPEEIFNEMASACEPKFIDVRVGDQSFDEAVRDVLRKHLEREIRVRGIRLADVIGRP